MDTIAGRYGLVVQSLFVMGENSSLKKFQLIFGLEARKTETVLDASQAIHYT